MEKISCFHGEELGKGSADIMLTAIFTFCGGSACF